MMKMNYKKISLVLVIGLLWCFKIQAQVLFEGYSKITLNGQFIGFTIQKYEFDTKKKNFISTSLIKYNEIGGSMTESLKAYANEALEPISYTYNLLGPSGVKTIDASFAKGVLTVKTTEKKVTKKKEIKLPKGSFFSSFLAYVILKNPQGLKTSSKYEYQAVAEEDGENYKGSAVVQSEETYKGLHVYKILNDYKGAQFISYTTDKGEMISTSAPQKSLSLELVADPVAAMGGLSVGADNLKILFGNIPEGKINALTMAASLNKSSVSGVNSPSGTSAAPAPVGSTATTPFAGAAGAASGAGATPNPEGAPGANPGTTTGTTFITPTNDSPTASPEEANVAPKTTKLKQLEPKLAPNSKEKKGTRPGLGIQTK